VVTGGAGLLGPEHAAALGVCGATVVITDIDLPRARTVAERLSDRHREGRFEAAYMDVTDAASIRGVRDELVRRHGRVDILVNNAAIDPKVEQGGVTEGSRFEYFPLEEWNAQIAVGLTGAFLCCQVFGTWMADHGGGVIVNIASDLSVFAPDQRLYRQEGLPEERQPVKPVAYSVIKTALIGLTRYLATYWADKGVRVNALSPGGVFTGQSDEFVHRLTNLIPLGRMAEADEYWGAIQFLTSDASRYMTGQNLVVDGGRSVW
jgi:NAD(P)-dependent dehydrogenase (short-subunit alcohol dehydrogenase family)